MRHRVSPLVKKVTNTYIFLPQFSVILFLVPSIRILSLDTSCDFDSTIKVITRAISVKGDKKLRCSPFARKREDGPVRVFMFQFTFFLFFFFFFFFLLSSRNIVRSCNRVSEGKKSWTNDPYRSRARRTLAHFFFFFGEEKAEERNYYVKGGAKGSSHDPRGPFFYCFLFYIYICISFCILYLFQTRFENLPSSFLRFFSLVA